MVEGASEDPELIVDGLPSSAGKQRGYPSSPSVSRWSCRIGLFAVLLANGLAGPAAAQSAYYRWTDESGNLVLSDRPPQSADQDYETVAVQAPTLRRRPATAAPPSPPVYDPGDASPPQPAVSRTEEDTAALPVERDPAVCKQARTNLEVLETKPRIRVYGDDGELRYLSPEQIEEQKAATQRAIDLHCEAG